MRVRLCVCLTRRGSMHCTSVSLPSGCPSGNICWGLWPKARRMDSPGLSWGPWPQCKNQVKDRSSSLPLLLCKQTYLPLSGCGASRKRFCLPPSLPGASRVARYMGAFDQPCMACGNVLEGEDDPKAHICSTPQCKGTSRHWSVSLCPSDRGYFVVHCQYRRQTSLMPD